MISTAIQQLVNYGLDTGLILPDDEIYIRNQLLMTMQLDDFTAPEGEVCYTDLESILKTLVDDAVARGVCEDNSTARDLFDTKLMGVLTPRPSIVRANFEERYENEGPQAATDWFYKFSQDTDYIRRYRIKRDLKWVTKTEYGDLDITINLSKPEKDPKAIAAAKLAPQSAYPKCQLCAENEGYAGRMNHPARENHRIIPLTINDSAWNLQYSPYVYYNEHCIVFNNQHTPMKIERATFRKLLDFVGLFPHYFVGSNADLPIVGGSILSHDHFQGGHYEFAMAKAPIEKTWVFPGFEDVEAGIVHWPMSCIRLTCADDTRLVELADKLLTTVAFIYMLRDGVCSPVVLCIILAREFAVSGLRMVAAGAKDGKVIAANMWGKVKTVLQMLSIIFYFFGTALSYRGTVDSVSIVVVVSIALCWLVAAVTAISGIKYLWDNRSFINTAK